MSLSEVKLVLTTRAERPVQNLRMRKAGKNAVTSIHMSVVHSLVSATRYCVESPAPKNRGVFFYFGSKYGARRFSNCAASAFLIADGRQCGPVSGRCN